MKELSVRDLEQQHHVLDLEIKRLERRGMHMTPPEVERSIELKKLRLQTLDMLQDLTRH